MTSNSPCLEPRRRVDQALYAVIMAAYIGGVSTRELDCAALGSQSGISKSQVRRICQEMGQQVQALLSRPLESSSYAYVYLDATYLKERLGKAQQVCCRAVVVAMGLNEDRRRELLGLKVGDSETESLWAEFISHLKERGLAGVNLMISDDHTGLTKAIRRQLQGSVWQTQQSPLCPQPAAVRPQGSPARMVTAALGSVLAGENGEEIESRWDDLAASLAFRHFPKDHWRKIWSTNLLERVNDAQRGGLGSAVIKRSTTVVGILSNDAAITRLVGAVLLEQEEHWQREGRRMVSAESMAAIPELDLQPALEALSA